jgi:hypothetical protein
VKVLFPLDKCPGRVGERQVMDGFSSSLAAHGRSSRERRGPRVGLPTQPAEQSWRAQAARFFAFFAAPQLLCGLSSCGRRARKWHVRLAVLQHSPRCCTRARRARFRAATPQKAPEKSSVLLRLVIHKFPPNQPRMRQSARTHSIALWGLAGLKRSANLVRGCGVE